MAYSGAIFGLNGLSVNRDHAPPRPAQGGDAQTFSRKWDFLGSATRVDHQEIVGPGEAEIAAGEFLDHVGVDALGPEQRDAPLKLFTLALQLVALTREPRDVLFVALAGF